MNYNDIVSLTDGPVRYAHGGRGHLRMAHKEVPLSILEPEFHYITNAIIEGKCQTGFEVATAFGISALAAALGFKQTGGKLVTMDAYIEENSADPNAYRGANKALYKDSMGFKSVNYLREKFDLQNNLAVECGWSPDDIDEVLERNFGKNVKLDYVFIDSGHFSEQLVAEVDALVKYTHKNTVFLFHDVYEYMFDPATTIHVMRTLNGKIDIIHRMPDGENLGRLIPFGESE